MKGISPLVATVLLIAFTVAVAGLLSNWLTGFASQSAQQVSSSSSVTLSCTYGGVSLGNLKYNSTQNNMTGYIENTGTVSIGNLSLQIIYTNKTIVTYNLCSIGSIGSNCTAKNISLSPRDVITFSVPSQNNYETLRVATNCSSVYDTATSAEISSV